MPTARSIVKTWELVTGMAKPVSVMKTEDKRAYALLAHIKATPQNLPQRTGQRIEYKTLQN